MNLMKSIIIILVVFAGLNSTNNKENFEWQGFTSKSTLQLVKGYSDNGEPTQKWYQAVQHLGNYSLDSHRNLKKKKLSTEELLWEDLIVSQLNTWESMIDSISIPFQRIKRPNKTTILIGNQEGQDAFVFADSIICFDLERLYILYGSANNNANDDRINRFFAHEYTHVLHKIWRENNSLLLKNPFEKALWISLTEGLGNYRSLSGKWLNKNGTLTAHAINVLENLQLVFVKRIKALKFASDDEARTLMKGISMGPFEKKWGALTVALWLAQEVQGSEIELQKWVEYGPEGILLLANKYLPKDLKLQLPKYK